MTLVDDRSETQPTVGPARIPLDDAGRALLFTEARTAKSFSSEPVSDAELASIWELTKWGPTAANTQPLRVVYVRTAAGKQRLLTHVNEGNLAKTTAAPVTAILAVDSEFHEHIPTVLPYRPELREVYAADATKRDTVGRFSASLQAGYFIVAVRAEGLVAGPMAGFDAAGVDQEFFADGRWKSILLVNIGHPGDDPWAGRLPRLDHPEVVRWA
jgi:3-hydroxypropanoate dehydrogenase